MSYVTYYNIIGLLLGGTDWYFSNIGGDTSSPKYMVVTPMVWGQGSWDWTLSILLHCIWTSYWRSWIIKINLSGHKSPARASLPFFINLDVEVEKEWKKAIFSSIHRFQHTSYADIEGMRENGYEGMPPVQEMIASLSLCGQDILSQGSLLAI